MLNANRIPNNCLAALAQAITIQAPGIAQDRHWLYVLWDKGNSHGSNVKTYWCPERMAFSSLYSGMGFWHTQFQCGLIMFDQNRKAWQWCFDLDASCFFSLTIRNLQVSLKSTSNRDKFWEYLLPCDGHLPDCDHRQGFCKSRRWINQRSTADSLRLGKIGDIGTYDIFSYILKTFQKLQVLSGPQGATIG